MDNFGIAPAIAACLRRIFDSTPAIERVWIYGSRARGDHREASDIDLAVDAPDLDESAFSQLWAAIQDAGLIYDIDVLQWQRTGNHDLRERIARDRKLFWSPRRYAADTAAIGTVSLKEFQSEVLQTLGDYLSELAKHRDQAERAAEALRIAELDVPDDLADYPRKTWDALRKTGRLPPAFAEQPYSSRFDGAGRPIPNLCLKLPTGGGKTLLAAAGVARVFSSWLRRSTGLVLWVVPNEAIYRQTWKALSDRDHPYRQILNVAGAGRVKILDKNAPLTRLDTDSHLCVMLLMLQSAARKSKETLRFFRDRGSVLGFLPREDDIDAHWELLRQVPNLDAYAPWGMSAEQARAQKGSIVKSSLGNAMRLIRPMVVIDEGHHAYSDTALKTLDGFNPSLMLELSATPRVASARASGSNILVDVRGTALDEAEMIKLPIQVDIKRWNDWQSCLTAAAHRLDALQREADALHAECARYIRPILLVQVERTGRDMRDAGFIHADDAKAFLLQLGFHERQIAIKTAETDELKQPENIDLLAPGCEIRAIITKQALQEGWDCPFAYVLCALAAGRNPAAMTQLVGGILRQPHVLKTGRPPLDACYVLCHDAATATVVAGIKRSLESEGMGDLALQVRSDEADRAAPRPIALKRRAPFAGLRLFVPRVTWADEDCTRRELVYDSDVLAHLPWEQLDPAVLAQDWAPDPDAPAGSHLTIDLRILGETGVLVPQTPDSGATRLDRARVARALLDVAPNAWLTWSWVDAVASRLTGEGFAEAALAASSASLTERLRIDIERERDRLAQSVFEDFVAQGRIEFRLRADSTDYEMPQELTLESGGAAQALLREDGQLIGRSLLEPALRTADMNEFEVRFAGYLDQRAALHWWHRNVAKSQLGLQGWRRHRVYPDFVFGLQGEGEARRIVLMETKGLHLAGSTDTDYKRALFERLTAAFRDERGQRSGELILEDVAEERIVCDLIFEQAWEGALEKRYFAAEPAQHD